MVHSAQDSLGSGNRTAAPSSVLEAEILSSHYLGGAQKSGGEGKHAQKELVKLSPGV